MSKASHKNGVGCVNCGTTRHSMMWRGYCKRCYPIVLRLERTRKWDPSRPETLRHYPKSPYVFSSEVTIIESYEPDHWERIFPQIKKATIRKLEMRLYHFKSVEEQLSGSVSGYDIEVKLTNLARLAGADRHAVSGIANAVGHFFDHKQRKLLFKWLTQIMETIRWRGIFLGDEINHFPEPD